MKKKRFFGMLATALTFGMMLAGCEDPNGGGGGGDTIAITSTATSGANLLIEVEYTLATRDDGEIVISFMQTSMASHLYGVTGDRKEVIKGTGSHTFIVGLYEISSLELGQGALPYICADLVCPVEGKNYSTILAEDIKKWNDTGGGDSGKPAKLSSGATAAQAYIKLNEIIAYPETPNSVIADVQEIKELWPYFSSDWSSSGASMIAYINLLIEAIP